MAKRNLFVACFCSLVLAWVGCKKSNTAGVQKRGVPNVRRGEVPAVGKSGGGTDKALMGRGKKIAKASFGVLKGKLMAAMKSGGPANALKFCATHAQGISKQLGVEHKAGVARVSHRARNPLNAADAWEKELIQRYAKMITAKKPIKPVIRTVGKQKVFYAPIKIIAPLCLMCHGSVGKEITKANAKLIKKHYPKDQATGFRMGELRGLWKISFGGS